MHFLKRGLLNPPTTNPPNTDQLTTFHLLIHQPTHRPPTHQSINVITIFKNLATYLLYRTQTQLLKHKTLLRSIIDKIFYLLASIEKHAK